MLACLKRPYSDSWSSLLTPDGSVLASSAAALKSSCAGAWGARQAKPRALRRCCCAQAPPTRVRARGARRGGHRITSKTCGGGTARSCGARAACGPARRGGGGARRTSRPMLTEGGRWRGRPGGRGARHAHARAQHARPSRRPSRPRARAAAAESNTPLAPSPPHRGHQPAATAWPRRLSRSSGTRVPAARRGRTRVAAAAILGHGCARVILLRRHADAHGPRRGVAQRGDAGGEHGAQQAGHGGRLEHRERQSGGALLLGNWALRRVRSRRARGLRASASARWRAGAARTRASRRG